MRLQAEVSSHGMKQRLPIQSGYSSGPHVAPESGSGSDSDSDSVRAHRCVVIVPAFNEAEVIAEVIAEIRTQHAITVVVVDDASTDDTIRVARNAGATVIPLASQLGAWCATQAGLRYALRNNYEIAITMDADGQHEPAAIPGLLQPITSGVADVTIGACTQRGSLMRRIAWVMLKSASGLSLEDVTSGFRVYNRNAIRLLAGWRATLLDFQDIGVLLLMQSEGLQIVDVPVQMLPRRNGKSRVFHSWLVVLFYMSQTLVLGLSKRQRARRVRGPKMVPLQ